MTFSRGFVTPSPTCSRIAQRDQRLLDDYQHPEPPSTVITISGLMAGHRATVEGRVRQVEEMNADGKTLHVVMVCDESGDLKVTFSPGHGGTDIQPGQLLLITGKARRAGNRPIFMSDPHYQVVEQRDGEKSDGP